MKRRQFLIKTLGLASAATATRASLPSSQAAYDVAIIGAGLFGSAAARHLAGLNDSVVLIGPTEPSDRGTHDGAFGSYFDNSRLTRIVDPDLIWGTMAKRSVERYRDIEKISAIPFYNEIGYMMVTPGGLGADWFDLPAMRKVAEDLEVEIEYLNDDELVTRYPYLDFTPGSNAIYQKDRAGCFNPRLLVRAQQTIAAHNGVEVIADEVADLRKRQQQFQLTTRSGATVTARRVLVATGAYANASNLLPIQLKLSVRAAMIALSEVNPAKRYHYPTTLYAKTDGEQDFWGLLMPPLAYSDGKHYLKTMDGYYGEKPLHTAQELGDWSRGEGHIQHHAVLKRALREVFPSLQVLSTQFKPCLITDTASRYPYIDMLEENLGIVIGGNGKSAKSSDEIGRIAANMIHSDGWATSLPRSTFSAQFA